MPYLQFPQQPDREQIIPATIITPAITNSGPCWSMMFACGFMIFITSSTIDKKLPKKRQRAQGPKEIQRPAHVLQKKSNRQQVEKHPESAADTIVALATLAIHVSNRNLADRRAIPTRQSRNKPMHLAVERNTR